MPAIEQVFYAEIAQTGEFTGDSCRFAGFFSNQDGKEENTCFFAGLMIHPKAFSVPRSMIITRHTEAQAHA
ncbi:hypothetical protein [Paenibacillus whitsoniae]|uniref:Uncharacterized protein n=1 Tax=Paenibacillus whitsoniae TaxID=2496558 RepID=A0A430JFY3_9BACL|nr:hypothetical protein [Paenibacillus whitsoniae]RTE09962.1 hypothetical protein EJQ19_09685 [Paenibacillus whitsoniae]